MDDEISSKRKYDELPKQISLLKYPICDGSGKQFNLQYTQYVPSITIFPSFLPKIPISRNFKSYEEYSYNMKKWYATIKTSFARNILPTRISLFYRRPLKTKTLGRGKNLITFDQLLQIEEILINEQKFNENTFFKNNIKSKSNLISQYISYANKWIGWSIPPFPEPEFFNCIEDFFIAANNWHSRCNQILNENVDKFISQTNLNARKNLITKTNSNVNRIKRNKQKRSLFNIPVHQHHSIDDDNSNDNTNDRQDVNTNNDNKSEKHGNNDTNKTNDNDNFNNNDKTDTNSYEDIKIESQSDFSSKNYIINETPKFEFLLHPISFHNKYNFEIVQSKFSSIKGISQSNLIPLKKINQNSFFNTIQFHSKLNFDENPKLKENISTPLKEMNYFDLKNAQYPFSNENPIIKDLINYGCNTTIRNSYPIPFPDKEHENNDDDYSTLARNFLYLLDLDKNKISKTECDSLFQYVLSNHSNELFQNLLNNTQFLYKIAVILSYYIPSSSNLDDIQIIEPFDESDDFLNIDGFGENFHFTPEIQIKLDLREIHGLLFQWHFSDVIYRIFGLIQSDNRQIEEASQTFLRRTTFYKDAFKKFAEKKTFPFSFLPRRNQPESPSLKRTQNLNENEMKSEKKEEKHVVIQIENEINKDQDNKFLIETENQNKNDKNLIKEQNEDDKDLTNEQKENENQIDKEERNNDNSEDEIIENDSKNSNNNLKQFCQRYKHLTRSYNSYTTTHLTRNSSISQFSQYMTNNDQTSKTTNNITIITNSNFPSHSNFNTSEISEEKKSPEIDFTSHSFIDLCTSIFKVSLLYDVSSYVCPNSFIFLQFVSKSYKDDQKSYKKFINEILTNRKMCIQFISDFTGYSTRIRFDISDSPSLLSFCCQLFQFDVRYFSMAGLFKIKDFEWTIQFFQHMARYLIDSYVHVYLIECILRFSLRSVDSENFCEWKSNVKTLQGLLYAYIPYENDTRLLASELRSFALLLKSADSFSFFDSDQKIGKVFRFLTVDNQSEILVASWKILGVLFVYHADAVASYVQKFDCLADFIEKAMSSLKNLTKFDLLACQLLKLIAKLVELALPSKYSVKYKAADHRNYFAALCSKNAIKGLTELLRILGLNQIRPNYLAFTIKNCLKEPDNSNFSHYIKIIERYEVAVASRPAIKKMFISYKIDFEVKL